MSLICMGLGTMSLGFNTTNEKGEIISTKPAQWTSDEKGGCVIVGQMDPETMEPITDSITMYSRTDASAYLAKAAELLLPERAKPFIDIPNMKDIIRKATMDGVNFCDYCDGGPGCFDCIVHKWTEDI